MPKIPLNCMAVKGKDDMLGLIFLFLLTLIYKETSQIFQKTNDSIVVRAKAARTHDKRSSLDPHTECTTLRP